MSHTEPSADGADERRSHATPTLSAVWAAAAVAIPGVSALVRPITQNDFWWHVATGRLILATGEIPTTDVWSFTRFGEPFVNQAWLAQLALYGVVYTGGVRLALVLSAVLVGLTCALVFLACLRDTANARLSALVVVGFGLPLGISGWSMRPQLVGLPLFAFMLLILSEYRRTGGRGWTRWAVWTLPLGMLLWANLHGSFIVGLALMGLVIAGETWKILSRRVPGLSWAALRTLMAVGLASVLATFLNPEGWRLYVYVGALARHEGVRTLIEEWAPPTVHEWWGIAFFIGAAVLVALFIYGRRRPDPTDLMVTAGFAAMALQVSRSIIWFALVGTVVAARQLRGSVLDRPLGPGSPLVNASFIAVLAVALVLSLPWVRSPGDALDDLVDARTPIAAVAFLQQTDPRPQRLFHDFSYGSYLIWAAPDQGVFIDPRVELYPHDQLSDQGVLSAGYDVDRLMAKYDIDGALLSVSRQQGLIDALRAHPNWRVELEAGDAVYFVPVDG